MTNHHRNYVFWSSIKVAKLPKVMMPSCPRVYSVWLKLCRCSSFCFPLFSSSDAGDCLDGAKLRGLPNWWGNAFPYDCSGDRCRGRSGPKGFNCSVRSYCLAPLRTKFILKSWLFALSLKAWAVAAVSREVVIVWESSDCMSYLSLGDPCFFVLLWLSTDTLRLPIPLVMIFCFTLSQKVSRTVSLSLLDKPSRFRELVCPCSFSRGKMVAFVEFEFCC